MKRPSYAIPNLNRVIFTQWKDLVFRVNVIKPYTIRQLSKMVSIPELFWSIAIVWYMVFSNIVIICKKWYNFLFLLHFQSDESI